MTKISEQLANLTQEQRDLLLKKLRESQHGQKPEPPAPPVARPDERRPFDPARHQNFRLLATKPGILEGLEYVVIPRRPPGPGEVEVEVYASSLNFGDVMVALGLYQKSNVMGSDCAGRVAAVGEGVEGLRVGDEVIAMAVDICCYSRYITLAAAAVVPKPQEMTFVEAATIPTVFLTVVYGLYSLAQLGRGERILIHSATGGVGLAALQYAESVGAEVYATVGTPEKREYLQGLGYRHILNSRSLDFADGVSELTGGEGVDVVLNALAGEAIPKGLSVLRPLGRFVELGRRDFFRNTPLGLAPFYRGLSFHSVSLGSLLMARPELFQSLMVMIVEGFARQTFKLLPMRVYKATEVVDAFEHMATGKHIGKLAVDFRNQEVQVVG